MWAIGITLVVGIAGGMAPVAVAEAPAAAVAEAPAAVAEGAVGVADEAVGVRAASGPRLRDVQVEVWEIRATKKDDKISDELRRIAGQLRKQFNYSGFRLVKRERGGAKPGETFTARLSSGVVAKITPSPAKGGKIRLKVQVSEDGKPKLNTTYTVAAGAMQLAGGWKYNGSDDAMILGIRAR